MFSKKDDLHAVCHTQIEVIRRVNVDMIVIRGRVTQIEEELMACLSTGSVHEDLDSSLLTTMAAPPMTYTEPTEECTAAAALTVNSATPTSIAPMTKTNASISVSCLLCQQVYDKLQTHLC